jgi:hypothetical protein
MPRPAQERVCFECKKPLADSDQFLVVNGPEGRQQCVHTLCFNDTTFDPDRYQQIPDPDTND